MRNIALWSVGALLLCASAAGCYDEQQHPAARTTAAVTTMRQPTAGGAVIIHHDDQRPVQQGVTELQPAAPPQSPPVINNFVTAPPPEATPPQDRLTEERARVSQAVAVAKQQIDRLTRMEQTSTPDRNTYLDSLIQDLQTRRGKVLQDMRELELRAPARTPDRLESDLYRDLDDLQASVSESYSTAAPPGSGMAPPAPLAPQQLP